MKLIEIGRWINADDHVICSNCGAIHYGVDKNFCPNCGTDMRDKRLNKMSDGITVKEFKHIPGVNDAEYIKKLEELQEIDKRIISKAIAKIKKLSAQFEHRTGQWIIHENADIIDGYYVPKYECSCCHTWKDDDSNFCPDCGTDMRERKDESNEYNTNDN